MEERDGWKRVRATLPDSRIIIKAEKTAKKLHKHHDILVLGTHYEYFFEKVAGQNSIIYRRLRYGRKVDLINFYQKIKIRRMALVVVMLLIILSPVIFWIIRNLW